MIDLVIKGDDLRAAPAALRESIAATLTSRSSPSTRTPIGAGTGA